MVVTGPCDAHRAARLKAPAAARPLSVVALARQRLAPAIGNRDDADSGLYPILAGRLRCSGKSIVYSNQAAGTDGGALEGPPGMQGPVSPRLADLALSPASRTCSSPATGDADHAP